MTTLLWSLLLCLGGVGAWIVFYAALGRLGTIPPRCRACRYPLTGLDDDRPPRCPECGAAMTAGAVETVVIERSRLAISVGLLLVAIAAMPFTVPVVDALRTADWIAWRWSSSLVAEVHRDIDHVEAWRELARRIEAGRLDQAKRETLFRLVMDAVEAGSVPDIVASRAVWHIGLNALTRGTDAEAAERRARYDAAFPFAQLSVRAMGEVRQGTLASLELSASVSHPSDVVVHFRLVGIRGIESYSLSPGGGAGMGNSTRSAASLATARIGLTFVPLAELGATEFVVLVEEMRIDPISPQRGLPQFEFSPSEPAPAIDLPTGGIGTMTMDPVHSLATLARIESSPPSGVIVRRHLHEIPVALDVLPALDSGVVHPALAGGVDNFSIVDVRARIVEAGNAESIEIELDVVGPRELPVSFRVSIVEQDHGRTLSSFATTPEDALDSTTPRTITISGLPRRAVEADRLTIQLTPSWSFAQHAASRAAFGDAPPDRTWRAIWGGHFEFRDVPIKRRGGD